MEKAVEQLLAIAKNPRCTDEDLDTTQELVQQERGLIDAKNEKGATVLSVATTYKNIVLVDRLISLGANIGEKNTDGRTALELTVQRRFISITKRLLLPEILLPSTSIHFPYSIFHPRAEHGMEHCWEPGAEGVDGSELVRFK